MAGKMAAGGNGVASLAGTGSVADQLYEKLKAHVRGALPHSAVLSERKLAAMHGISVGTVRRALERLVTEGLVYKKHGKGNFVAEHGATLRTACRILYADTWGDTTHPFYVRNLGAMAVEAERHGFRLEILPYPTKFRKPEEAASMLREASDPATAAVIVPWLGAERYDALMEVNPRLKVVSATQELNLPGTAVVLPDRLAAGRMAGQYLAAHGGKRIALVHRHWEAEAGLREVFRNVPGSAVTVIEAPIDSDPDTTADALATGEFDGAAFFDDRVAHEVLATLVRKKSGILKKLRTVSLANAGENILPAETARLQVDGHQIGLTLIEVIRAMVDDERFGGTSIYLRPTMILPEKAPGRRE